MGKLFIRIFILLTLIGSTLFLYFKEYANGYIDPFYTRFTTAPANSLIVGTSRAAQGLQPAVFNKQLEGLGLALPVFNYSFTIVHSPYGPYYLKSIRKKLKKNTTNGLFIVTVDPWSLSSENNGKKESQNFREANSCVGNMQFVNMNPNFEYMFSNYAESLFRLPLLDTARSNLYLHDNGWLEVRVPDNIEVAKNIENKLDMYKNELFPVYRFSQIRYNYFEETINFLKQKGQVYLVRLPVSKEMAQLEFQFMPDFDEKINATATKLDIPYYNFINKSANYQTIDGNHLHRNSGRTLSEELCQLILENTQSEK